MNPRLLTITLTKDGGQASSVFSLSNKKGFEKKALEIFHFQAEQNPVYKKYVEQIGINPEKVKTVSQIPFLPIEFFKTHEVVTGDRGQGASDKNIFMSSGTTSENRSKHYVSDISLYEKSFRKCFEIFYGNISQYAILALLPSYYENRNSSLMYMVQDLIKRSKNKYSSFYNHKDETLLKVLQTLSKKKQKIILFGVSFALLDLAEKISKPFTGAKNLIVIETGGMKGRREEITRNELHKTLCKKLGAKKIHSEYGMTELLSQTYSKGDGIFNCPPWMKVFIRDVNDPFQILPHGKTGALNIIDLANIHSCSFIATQDVGRIQEDDSFEVLGRMDNSDLRGCNLLAG